MEGEGGDAPREETDRPAWIMDHERTAAQPDPPRPKSATPKGEFGYFIGRVLFPIALAAGGLWVFRRWNPDLEIWSPWLFVGGVLIQLITMLPDALS